MTKALTVNELKATGTEQQIVAYILDRRNNITVPQLHESLAKMDISVNKSAKKNDLALVVARAWVDQRAKKEKEQATGETPVADKPLTKESAINMDNVIMKKVNAAVEEVNSNWNAQFEKATAKLNTLVEQNTVLAKENTELKKQVTALTTKPEYTQEELEKVVTRINTFYGHPVSNIDMPVSVLKNMLNQVRGEEAKKQQAQVVAVQETPAVGETPTADTTTNKGEATVEDTKKNVDEIIAKMTEEEKNKIVFDATQADLLAKYKKSYPGLYENAKESMEKFNRATGRTVENVLRYPNRYAETAHEAVDASHKLVGNLIDGVKGIAISLVETTATAAHGVNNAGKQLGHVIVDGVVYSFDSAGNLFKQQPTTTESK